MAENSRPESSTDAKRLIAALGALDDSSYERVMKKCCEFERPVELLKTVLNARDCTRALPELVERNRGAESEPEFTVGAEEDKIITAMNGLSDEDYADVFTVSSSTRSDELFKKIKKCWMYELGLTAIFENGDWKMKPSKLVKKEKSPDIDVIDLSPSVPTEPDAARSRSRSRSPRGKRYSPKPRRRSSVKSREYSPTTSRPRSRRKSASETRRRTRSKSRSPLTKRARAHDSAEPQRKVVKNKLFLEKLALTAEGIWTGDMEIRWKVVEIEEEKLTKEFEVLEGKLIRIPENHPKYDEEWTKFWKNKVQGIQKTGEDPSKYNFVPEWKEFWIKDRMGELLELEFEAKLQEIRKKHGMDLETLIRIRMNKGETNGPFFQPDFDSKFNDDATGPGSDNIGGFYIIQLLRRMTLLDCQLSFLAPKVFGYFEKAKEMEISRKGSAKRLLSDHDFLKLLQECRFRFQALIQTDVLPFDVMDAMDKSITAVDQLLESSQCQNALLQQGQSRRSRRSSSVQLASPTRSPKLPLPAISLVPQQNFQIPAGPENGNGDESPSSNILKRVEHLSSEEKSRLADLMANILSNEGREAISDTDLLEFTMKSLDPLSQFIKVTPLPPPPASPKPKPKDPAKCVAEINLSQSMWRRHELPDLPELDLDLPPQPPPQSQSQQPELPPAGLPWAGDFDRGVRRSIGTAMPVIAPVVAKAVSPPPEVLGQTLVHYQNVRPESFNEGSARNTGEQLRTAYENSEWIPLNVGRPGSILTFTRRPPPPIQVQNDETVRNGNSNR